MLEVVIGLVFIYLVFSLVVTAMSEVITTVTKRRASMLREGVDSLLNTSAAAKIYDHPLLESLQRQRNGRRIPPSYIPTRTFVLALLDIAAKATPGQTPQERMNALAAALATKRAHGVLSRSTTEALRVLLVEAGDDVEAFQKQVGKWFDNAMDRVGGWYKRRTQAVLLALAAALTIGTNADSIQIMRVLWEDPQMRASLLEQAATFIEENPGASAEDDEGGAEETTDTDSGTEADTAETVASDSGAVPADGPDAGAPPPGEADSSTAGAEADAEERETAEAVARQELTDALDRLDSLGLPLGWAPPCEEGEACEPTALDRRPTSAGGWVDAVARHWLGWVLTTLAVSLGAPFWFDTLATFVAIRSAGKAPKPKTGEEESDA